MDLAKIYDRQFFAKHQPWRSEYDAISDALIKLIDFSSVLDLGCGNGFFLDRFQKRGKRVRGVDGSVHALSAAPAAVRPKLAVADLTAPLRLGRYDLVVCSEVAEHLDARHADTLVDTICANAGQWVFFTAATPGQIGVHHVNGQPHAYWTAKFEHRGFQLDTEATDRLRQHLAKVISIIWWFKKNAMILRAPADAPHAAAKRAAPPD